MGYDVNEVYASQSDYLKAADLQKQKHQVTIQSIDMAEFDENGRKTKKLILHFVGKPKSLVLNKTNSDTIMYVLGPDTDQWLQKSIILYPTLVDYQGRSVEAIRVEMPMAMAPQGFEEAVSKVSTTAVDDQHAPDPFDDVSVPF